MIIDLPGFVANERPFWQELERLLGRLAEDPGKRLSLAEARRFHYLYQRASADLARLVTFSSERELRTHLEGLVGRAYAEIHEGRRAMRGISLWRWLGASVPSAVRRHAAAVGVATAVTLFGAGFGAAAVALDPDAKEVLLPFPHLLGDPAERVRWEEEAREERHEGGRATFSGMLMTHNTRVAITALALGMTFGVGTVVLLFYNGAILGAVACDYLRAGEGAFLLGWLLPHGAFEIPAVVLAGAGGLVLASALLRRDQGPGLRGRLRAVAGDLITLIGGVGVMLVWAGIVEAFLSQDHEPRVPYALKIALGVAEAGFLAAWLLFGGRRVPGERRG